MLKESFFMGALIGAAVGIMLYKNNSDTKIAFDKGEKMLKSKVENVKKDLSAMAKKK